MSKKRVMLCGESSFLSTGFSTYGLELLTHLHNTDKYELFEFSSYGEVTDPRSIDLPWRYKTCMFDPRKPGDEQAYLSNPSNQFGEWKFEEACLEFRPDIVLDIRDWWMMEYQDRSPFRNYFHWAIMPTVDAAPQDEQWIATYMNANGVFSYSDWGLDLLKSQSNGFIKTICSAPPGADLETYSVVEDVAAKRKSMGIDPEALIVGTVMRNQRRKLYPDLIHAFAEFLKAAPPEIAKKTFLYLHTSWPDVGWNIPRLIKEAGVSHKTLFTYSCINCGTSFPSFFMDSRCVCRVCGQPNATFSNTKLGVNRKILGEIISLFDVYVQYANSEGFGMPQVDAAACGVPVMAVDYSAMSDVVRKLKGMPIKVLAYSRESETHCNRAIPDNKDFVQKLIEFLQLPQPVRRNMGYKARRAVEEHYTWPKTCKKWEDYIDSIVVPTHDKTWLSPAKLHTPNTNAPPNLTHEAWTNWALANIAGRPDLVNTYIANKTTKDLTWEATLGFGMGGLYFNESSTLGVQERFQPFNRDIATQIFFNECQRRNHWERMRTK